jgi:protein involved in polysaccharide export with SLBB domain
MISQWLTFTRLWAVLLGLCSALFAAQIQPVRAAELGGNKLAPFGANLFTGAFSKENFTAFSPDYRVQIGDKVNLRVWGGVSFDGALPVDPQGNVFIPNVGPVRVLGVRNGELNELVTKAAANVYKSTVNVYATLDAAQPVRIFVTGFVKNPGLYSGVSADSVLRFVDKAGGIDPDRGSFIDVTLLRGGQPRSKFNLYQFISEGRIDLIPLSDGDTIVVAARRSYVSIAGDVMNAAASRMSYRLHAPSRAP